MYKSVCYFVGVDIIFTIGYIVPLLATQDIVDVYYCHLYRTGTVNTVAFS